MSRKSLSYFHGQLWHLLVVIISTIGLWLLLLLFDITPQNEFWGISGNTWYWLAILVPAFHQLTTGLLWRSELLFKSLTSFFGSTKNGFRFFKIYFGIFFISRILITIPVSIATRNTVENDIVRIIFVIVGVVFVPLVVYLGYSVRVYFGINRAFGADHFYDEYKEMPMVKEGIFKYTNNAMYTFGLLGLWLPGLFLFSYVGVQVGIFSHGLVWAHYFFTEKPDMSYIYG